MAAAHFTEPTTQYWQRIVPADEAGGMLASTGPWQLGYPARLPDGSALVLPIRQLAAEPTHAVASLLVNQASLEVVDTLAEMLAMQLKKRFAGELPTLVIGLPTLGLALAPGVARALGHARYLPMGYSRKFWYDESLSAPVHSITSPVPGKRIYLDPHLLPLLAGERIVLVDDALSTGTTMLAAWDLLESIGADVSACGVAMCQGRKWADKLGVGRAEKVVGVFDSPLLQAVPGGWALRD